MKTEFYKMEYEAWDEGTDGMSLELEGAYLRTCHQMYRRRGPIPNEINTLSRIWRCHPNKARKLLGLLLDTGKITQTPEGHLTQTRVMEELHRRETIATQRAEAGRTGGTQRAQNAANALIDNDATAAVACLQPQQNPHIREEERRGESESRRALRADGQKDYVFEGVVIKLMKKDYDNWEKAYPNLDLRAELATRDSWLSTPASRESRDKWFVSTASHLNNLNRKAREETRQKSKPMITASDKPKHGKEHDFGGELGRLVYIMAGTSDWRALEIHIRNQGKPMPTQDRDGGHYFKLEVCIAAGIRLPLQ